MPLASRLPHAQHRRSDDDLIDGHRHDALVVVRVGQPHAVDVQRPGHVVDAIAPIGQRLTGNEQRSVGPVPAEGGAFGERGIDAAEADVIAAIGLQMDGGLVDDANVDWVDSYRVCGLLGI